MLQNIQDMHYDFKQKLNKIDVEKYRNLRVPEIDWKLREAEEVFIKMIAEPRYRMALGFETSQRSIDDIKNIVVNFTDLQAISAIKINDEQYYFVLPTDYMHYISSYVKCKKGSCTKKIRTHIRQHDDKFQESSFNRSSFEWEDVNGVFYEKGLKIFTDNSFEVESLILNYIRKPRMMHNAAAYMNGTYNLPDGTTLTGTVNSELPVSTYSEIVDIAVLITTGDLIPDYNVKQAKLGITN